MSPGKLKKFAYWILAVLAFSLATLSVAISFIDWNQYRDTLSDLASDQMDMRVDLAGNVSVALFPRPSVSAETVRIAPTGQENSDIVATADKISLRLGVASFLQGKAAIQSLALEGLSLALDETAAGEWRVRGWPEASGGAAIDLSRLDIENGRLSLTPFEGTQRSVEGLNVHLSGALPSGPLVWQGNFTLDGQQIQTEGRLKPVSGRNEVSVKADFLLGDSKVNASGRVADSGDMTGRLLLEGPELGATVTAVYLMATGDDGETTLPNIPFKLDMQLDIEGGIARAVSRQFTLADTRGRVDLTIARSEDTNHIAGALSLGVIDADLWRSALPVASNGAPSAEQPVIPGTTTPFSGALDVTIEGVRMNGGLGQRVDAVLAFKKDRLAVTNLQALLPGAANLSLIGDLGAEDGKSTVHIEIGNLAGLANWVGVELPDAMPAGRLATASARAVLEYQGGVWAVTDLDGSLDTSKIRGELSGEIGNLKPSHIKLFVDTLDLDVFTFEHANGAATSNEVGGVPQIQVPENVDVGLDISVAALHGFDSPLGQARFVGTLKPGRLDIDFLSLQQDDSTFKVEGTLTNSDNDVALELAADFSKWNMSMSRFFVPQLQEYLLAAGMGKLDGTASVAGAFSKMRLGFEATAHEQDISLSGEIGFPQNRLTFVQLQGGLKHKDLAGIARLAGVGDYRLLPVQLTYALSKTGTGEAFEAKIGGDLAGGKVQAEIRYFSDLEKIVFSYDHDSVEQLEGQIGQNLDGLSATEGVRAELKFERDATGWIIDIPSIKNGDRSLSGNLRVGDNKQFSGALTLSELVLSTELSAGAAARNELMFGERLRALADYAGTVDLALSNVSLSGQSISAPSASFSVGDGTARISLGTDATVNAKPATLALDAALEQNIPFEAKANIEGLSIAQLMLAQGVGDIVEASMAGELSLKGDLASSTGVMASLSGAGKFEGGAGKLKFLSVAGLVHQISTAQTGRGFLSEVGSLLRSGDTPFGTFRSSFSVDGGVMLIETLEAAGNWGLMALDGQVNLTDRYLSLKGSLNLSNPVDTPAIPVQYEGPFGGPNTSWSSRSFERFVIAGIERRLRAGLFQEMESRQQQSGETPQNPGLAVFSRAFGLLTQLKADQAEKKRLAEEAQRKAEALKQAADALPQGSEEQRP